MKFILYEAEYRDPHPQAMRKFIRASELEIGNKPSDFFVDGWETLTPLGSFDIEGATGDELDGVTIPDGDVDDIVGDCWVEE